MCNMLSSKYSILKILSTEKITTVSMNPSKRSYAEVLKTPFPALNPRLRAESLIAKPTRVRLSEDAKANLRAAIRGEPILEPSHPCQEPVHYTQL